MNPRIPGLGLAPTIALDDVRARWREAMLRDSMSAEQAARRDADGTASLFEVLRRHARTGGVELDAAKAPGGSRPSRPAAQA
jgi:hypothetical protein